MGSLNTFEEVERLACELAIARDVRHLLTTRFAAIALVTVLLAAVHLVPWDAAAAATVVGSAVIGIALVAERNANARLMRSPVIRSLHQSDTPPTVRS